MSYVATVEEEGATGAAEALYAEAREAEGFVPNSTKAFSLRPEYLVGWEKLLAAIKARMELRRYELVTLAAAKALRSSYCMLAHGSVALREFCSEDELRAIAKDHRRAGLAPVEVAVMDFATAVVRGPSAASVVLRVLFRFTEPAIASVPVAPDPPAENASTVSTEVASTASTVAVSVASSV